MWRGHLREAWSRLASTRPRVFWVEDDIRFSNHAPVRFGCFCDEHLRRYAELAGREVSREALISTYDSFLHTWGSAFVQDVVLPFRRRPLPKKRQLRLLRASIAAVAGFELLFSLYFPKRDRILAYAIVGWFLLWLVFFLAGTLYARWAGAGESGWLEFWHVYLWILAGLATFTTVWFTVGGIRDIRRFFHQLRTQERDDSDDGFVEKQ